MRHKKSFYYTLTAIITAFGFFIFMPAFPSHEETTDAVRPQLHVADDVAALLENENLKKDFAVSFLLYARNQGVSLSQLKAEYYAAIILDRAAFYNLAPKLVKAILISESGANERAVSIKGAIGLMQIMPQTARLFLCGEDLFEPEKNINCGVRVLSAHIAKYGEYAGVRYYICGEGSGNTYGCLYGFRTEAYLAHIKREAAI